MMIVRLLSLLVLLIAAYKDIKDRIIPNWMPGCIAVLSFFMPDGPLFAGLLAALPLLVAACIWGGIGGGDIKLMAALGLVFGFRTSLWGLALSLLLLIAYHMAQKIFKESKEAFYPMVPFLFVGMLGCHLIL